MMKATRIQTLQQKQNANTGPASRLQNLQTRSSLKSAFSSYEEPELSFKELICCLMATD